MPDVDGVRDCHRMRALSERLAERCAVLSLLHENTQRRPRTTSQPEVGSCHTPRGRGQARSPRGYKTRTDRPLDPLARRRSRVRHGLWPLAPHPTTHRLAAGKTAESRPPARNSRLLKAQLMENVQHLFVVTGAARSAGSAPAKTRSLLRPPARAACLNAALLHCCYLP